MRRKSSVFQPQLVIILRQGAVAPELTFYFLLFKQTYYKSVLLILRRAVLCGLAILSIFFIHYLLKPGFTAYYSCRLILGQWPFIPFVT